MRAERFSENDLPRRLRLSISQPASTLTFAECRRLGRRGQAVSDGRRFTIAAITSAAQSQPARCSVIAARV